MLSLIAVSCALLGPFLVLRRMTMLANSISHTVLLGLALSYLLVKEVSGPWLLLGALFAGILTALCTGFLTRYFRLQEDASVGLVFTALFSIGVLIVTLHLRDAHLCAEVIMGNADVLGREDLLLSLCLALVNGVFFTLLFRSFQFASFDRPGAAVLGLPCASLDALLLFLTAFSCVGAFRAVGILVVLSFLVGPYLIARCFFHNLKTILFCACGIGVIASLLSVALSRHVLTSYDLPLSTGGIVACLLAIFYLGALVFSRGYEKTLVTR